MGRQYIVIATISWEDAALWTTLLGTSLSSTEAFKILESFDYKKVIAEEFNIDSKELIYDHCTKSFGVEPASKYTRYDEDHIVRNTTETKGDEKEAFVYLTIFEN